MAASSKHRLSRLWSKLSTMAGSTRERFARLDLKPQLRERFEVELAKQAVTRMRIFGALLGLLHVFMVARDQFFIVPSLDLVTLRWQHALALMHMLILGVTASTVWLLSWPVITPAVRSFLSYALSLFLLCWAAWLAGIDQIVQAGIAVYIIVCLCTAVFVTFTHIKSAVLFASGAITMLVSLHYFQPVPALRLSLGVNSLGLTLACFAFSRILYRASARNFAYRETIAEQGVSLAQANSNLSQSLEREQRLNDELTQKNRLLRAEQATSERLLLNVLPPHIANRLKAGDLTIAETYTNVTVVFADIVSFTQLASRLKPEEVVTLLDELFARFHRLAKHYGLEQIKTLGDAYIAARGIPTANAEDAAKAANMALALHTTATALGEKLGHSLKLRVGLAAGEAVAGVIGRDRFSYDLWGDAINTASRMQSLAEPGETLVTGQVAARLALTHELLPKAETRVKGKGLMRIYTVVRRLHESVESVRIQLS